MDPHAHIFGSQNLAPLSSTKIYNNIHQHLKSEHSLSSAQACGVAVSIRPFRSFAPSIGRYSPHDSEGAVADGPVGLGVGRHDRGEHGLGGGEDGVLGAAHRVERHHVLARAARVYHCHQRPRSTRLRSHSRDYHKSPLSKSIPETCVYSTT